MEPAELLQPGPAENRPEWPVEASMAAAGAILLMTGVTWLLVRPTVGEGPVEPTVGLVLWGFASFQGMAMAAIVVVLCRRQPRGSRLRELGFLNLGLHALKQAVLWTLLAIPLVLGVGFLVHFVWQSFGWQTRPDVLLESMQNASIAARVTLIAGAALAAPVAEELIFRQVLYRAIESLGGARRALLMTSMIFACMHMHLESIPALFVLALLLQRVRNRTGSIWQPILIHAFFNAGMIALAFTEMPTG